MPYLLQMFLMKIFLLRHLLQLILCNDLEKIAFELQIPIVPIVGKGTLDEGIRLVKKGLQSRFGEFEAEGIVCKPKTQLFDRMGRNIITKIKYKDFKKEA